MKKFSGLIFFLFLLFWAFLHKEAIFHQLGGTFAEHPVPSEYTALSSRLATDTTFYRTFWVPKQQRFTYYDFLHPSIEAVPYFNASSLSALLEKLQKPETEEKLAMLSVKYVMIPYDSLGEIFLKDRKYDVNQRKAVEDELDKITYLKKISSGNLTIYEMKKFNSLFSADTHSLRFSSYSPDEYALKTNFNEPTIVKFSQMHHPSWSIAVNGKSVEYKKTAQGLIEFEVAKGKNTVVVTYSER